MVMATGMRKLPAAEPIEEVEVVDGFGGIVGDGDE